MIIGLVGQNCSGKDTAAQYLESVGFEKYSLSDYLRQLLANNKELLAIEKEKNPSFFTKLVEIISPGGKKSEITREKLIQLGNSLRDEFGSGVLGERALLHFKPGKDYAVSSIRTPAEAKALMQNPDFVLVALDAPASVRFQRMNARHREEDPKTFDEFMAVERKENEGGERLSVSETMKMAKYTIDSSTSIEDEIREVEKLCKKLGVSL